jgi:hypothetical protein
MSRLRCIPLVAAALAVVAIPAADATAHPVRVTFKVSLYGVQRYTSTSVRKEQVPDNPFDSRGTLISRSVVRFKTPKPRLATFTGDASYVNIDWKDDELVDLPVLADFNHFGSTNVEVATGDPDGARWEPGVVPTVPANCHQTLDWLGYSLSMSSGRAEVLGGAGLVPIGDPFAGCPYGDLSKDLYPAKGRVSIGALLRDEKSEFTLRFKDTLHSQSNTTTGDVVKRATVYVVLKRVGAVRAA